MVPLLQLERTTLDQVLLAKMRVILATNVLHGHCEQWDTPLLQCLTLRFLFWWERRLKRSLFLNMPVSLTCISRTSTQVLMVTERKADCISYDRNGGLLSFHPPNHDACPKGHHVVVVTQLNEQASELKRRAYA